MNGIARTGLLVVALGLGITSAQGADADSPFSGRSLAGWTTVNGQPVNDAWEASNGEIRLRKKPGLRGGNIVTAEEYEDFEFSFEWQIAPGGNNGIKYRVRSYNGQVLGCEYQIYDDLGAKNRPAPNKGAGALYDLYEPQVAPKLKPAGEFNQGKIVVRGQCIEHWLNGDRLVLATVGDDEWKRRIAASKFNDKPGFSEQPRGKIMITDHGSEVTLRNLQFRILPAISEETHVYKTVEGLAIRADVIAPRSSEPRPVVVWIHGGALINGHRASLPAWLRDAALDRGYALVSIDYRLAPETKLPEIVADVVDALRWIRERGPSLFAADPQRIGVVGGSAGGYLTLLTGHRADPPPRGLVSLWGYGDLLHPEYNSPSPHARHQSPLKSLDEAQSQVAGPPIADSRDRRGNGGAFYQFCRQQGIWPAIVTGWNPRTEAERYYPYLPERNVSSRFPPTFLIHGDADTDVPYAASAKMAELLEQHGIEHRLVRFAGAEHGLPGVDRGAVDEAYRAAFAFLTKQLER